MESALSQKKGEAHSIPGREENGCPNCGKSMWKVCPSEFMYCLIIAFLLGAVAVIILLKALHWLNTPTVSLSMPTNQM
ncbi:MAG TPA: hypothetical protein VGZ93_08650 [Candidatus Methylacidiphilales bacterium]|jgi:hypothetical protein|nr:hypothetical protein [Candidatus Methylacidiphilales bacterium]